MTDLEIINYLSNIKPESEEQAERIKKAINIFTTPVLINRSGSIEEFLFNIPKENILYEKSIVIYDAYADWCKKNNYTQESKKALGQAIYKKYNVTSKHISSNNINFKTYIPAE